MTCHWKQEYRKLLFHFVEIFYDDLPDKIATLVRHEVWDHALSRVYAQKVFDARAATGGWLRKDLEPTVEQLESYVRLKANLFEGIRRRNRSRKETPTP